MLDFSYTLQVHYFSRLPLCFIMASKLFPGYIHCKLFSVISLTMCSYRCVLYNKITLHSYFGAYNIDE